MTLPSPILTASMKSAADAQEGGGPEEVWDAPLTELWVKRVSEGPVVDVDTPVVFKMLSCEGGEVTHAGAEETRHTLVPHLERYPIPKTTCHHPTHIRTTLFRPFWTLLDVQPDSQQVEQKLQC